MTGETDRLRMEPLDAAHAAVVFEPLQAEAIYTYLPTDPLTLEALQRRYDFLAGAKSPDGTEDWLNWVVFDRLTDDPIGTFQATVPQTGPASIAYVIFPPNWRLGYGRETVAWGVEHLFSVYPNPALYAEVDTRNAGSIALLERLGFQRTGHTEGADFFKGAPSHEYRYTLERVAWELSSQTD